MHSLWYEASPTPRSWAITACWLGRTFFLAAGPVQRRSCKLPFFFHFLVYAGILTSGPLAMCFSVAPLAFHSCLLFPLWTIELRSISEDDCVLNRVKFSLQSAQMQP